ncbi:MAG: PCMD domain-containing protein [Bacteroidales bacterium]|nr:PCMD domain-containing protein [Bacteroidales bacterium]
MNILKKILIVLLVGFVTSCNKDGGSAGTGFLKLNISQDESLVVVGTKAEADPVYKVEVQNSEGVVVASYDNHNDLATSPLKLKAGKYTVIGTTGENGGHAAFGMPVYQGKDEVEVVVGQTTTAEVVCTLSQVKVTVKCDKSVTDAFKTVIVTVTNHTDFSDGSRNLIYSSDKGVADDGSIGGEGYFQCTGLLKYSIYLINQDDEISDGDVFGTIENVSPKEHYIFNLSLSENDEGGAIIPGIGVDTSTNDREYDVNVNLNKKAKPAFSTNGFNLDNTAYISIGSTLTWQVNVISKAGIEKLVVSHNSAELTNRGIPASFNLISMSETDKSAVNNAGLVWSGVVAGTKETMSLDFSTLLSSLPLGDYEFIFTALDMQAQEVIKSFKFKVIPAVETSTISADPWGRHAFLYGMYNTVEQPSGVGFEYRKESDATWQKVTSGLTFDGANYSVKVTGLEPRTKYIFRTVSDKEPSNEIEFTTLGADQIANMSFDAWYKSGKHWYPNASADNFLWDSGNEGANTLSEVNPTQPTTNVAVAGTDKQAAILKSATAAGQFAAGSLFLGDFVKATLSPLGANLHWGRPYDCKPLSLKGYYNYTPVTINKTKAPHTDKQGTMDICQIYVVLADWPAGYFEVSTGDSKFIDVENDPNIIGYGSLENNAATNGWLSFEIPIEYRNNRIPTTCVIVCSSSKYGDYFTGGVGSTLIVDEFEFTF